MRAKTMELNVQVSLRDEDAEGKVYAVEVDGEYAGSVQWFNEPKNYSWGTFVCEARLQRQSPVGWTSFQGAVAALVKTKLPHAPE